MKHVKRLMRLIRLSRWGPRLRSTRAPLLQETTRRMLPFPLDSVPKESLRFTRVHSIPEKCLRQWRLRQDRSNIQPIHPFLPAGHADNPWPNTKSTKIPPFPSILWALRAKLSRRVPLKTYYRLFSIVLICRVTGLQSCNMRSATDFYGQAGAVNRRLTTATTFSSLF